MVVTHVQHSSRASRDLADQVVAAVTRFRSENPNTTDDDVEAAMAVATERITGGSGQGARVKALVLAATGMVVAGFVALAANPRAQDALRRSPWLIVSAVIVVIAAGVTFAVARGRD